MKSGKLTEAQCKRSILRLLPASGAAVIQGAGIGYDYGAVQLNKDCQMVTAISTMTLAVPEPEKYTFWKALNKLETSGAVPVAIMVNLLLPARGSESRIREITGNLANLCMLHNLEYLGGHTELLEELRTPAVTVIAYGSQEEQRYSIRNVKPGESILMLGYTAMEATAMLLADKWEELNTRYAAGYLEGAGVLGKDLSLHRAIAALSGEKVTYIHDISTGGVFAALWELGEGAGCGLEAFLRTIPIRQETVEICEFFDINPYMAMGGGSALVVTPEAEAVLEQLKQHEIFAIRIGQTTEQNDRIVTNADYTRYLEPPKGDEIYKLYRN
ncbi:MAG: AIR synthase-related protein [Bacteroides sp.]|nr:AIR synthase-related protein [Bacteroides sp.]MCM1548916.1 AIR synthase-related protein [Clostridium sp.]